MATIRISSKEANQISDANVFYFDKDAFQKRIFVPRRSYYGIVADSPARGVIVSRKYHRGFERADADYYVGRANGESGTVVCFTQA